MNSQNPAVPKEYRDLLYLLACALNRETPDRTFVCGMDPEALFQAAKFHSLTATAAVALESCGAWAEDVRWQNAKNASIRRSLLFDAERQEILRFMEREGIWYMPLKGVLLQELYPKYGMRQMADNDILYDPKGQKKLLQFMTERGYEAEMVGQSNDDDYIKPPIYNFEMHTALFMKLHGDIFYNYYANVKERLIRDEGNAFGYHFSDEDFYIFLLAHAYKHYSTGGTGLRILTDIQVYLRQKEALLRWDYIESELEKLGIRAFEQLCRSLSKKLLSHPADIMDFDAIALAPKERETLAMLMCSGAYGTLENHIRQELGESSTKDGASSRSAKWRYILRRLFPSAEFMRVYYPFFGRSRLLLPLGYICRIFSRAIVNRKKLRKEFDYLKKNTSED